MASINSALVTRRLLFSTKYLSASNTFGRSFTSWPLRSRQPRPRSSVKLSNEYVQWDSPCILGSRLLTRLAEQSILALAQADSPKQVCESWVRAKAVKLRLDSQPDHVSGSHI